MPSWRSAWPRCNPWSRRRPPPLTAHRGDMTTLLGALERLSIEPRETLLLGWRSPMDTVITAQLLGFAVPPIEAKAHQLHQDLDDIAQLRAQALRQRQEHHAGDADAEDRPRARWSELVALKAGLRQTTRRRARRRRRPGARADRASRRPARAVGRPAAGDDATAEQFKPASPPPSGWSRRRISRPSRPSGSA